MGMIIYNNLQALNILNVNNQNIKKASKAMGELSLGEKIRNAGDDASGYSITEKMKGKIRALRECKANSSKGQNMLDLASKAVDEQVNILKKVKVCALKATDDTHTDADRATIQKEVGQLLDQCDDIAHQTTFNGIHLLNQRTVTKTDYWFNSDAPYRPNVDNIPVLTQAVSGGYMVPSGDYVTIAANGANTYDASTVIQGGGATTLPTDGNWVWDNSTGAPAKVVADTDGTLYLGTIGGTRVMVSGMSNPPANPADSSTNISVLAHPANTTVPVLGAVVANSSTVSMDSVGNVNTAVYTVVNAPGSGALSYYDTSKSSISVMEIDFTTLQGAVSTIDDLDGKGFSLNCGGCDQFITIMFDSKSTITSLYEGSSGNPVPLAYKVGIAGVDMANLASSLPEIIFNSISAANPVSGGATLPSVTDEVVYMEKPHRHNIQLNYYAATDKFTFSKNGPSITFMNGIRGEMVTERFYKPYQIKELQTDVMSSQYTRVTLPTTTVDAMFPSNDGRWDTDVSVDDYPEEWPKGYSSLNEAEKRLRWAEEVWQYPIKIQNFNRNDCVTTREKANVFLRQLEQALKHLLNSNTTLGAESARLNFTIDNLIVREENETNSLSVMRDTDMAKSYAEYMKHNILGQASQAMLAQANQDAQDVLSLLQ